MIIFCLMRKSLIFFLLFSFLLSSFSFCQTPKQWAKLGDDASADGDFIGAAIYYKNALSFDSTDLGLSFRYAEALRRSNDYALAGYYYQKIYDADVILQMKNTKGTSGGQPSEGRELCLFWLATMQKFNGDYDNALGNFKKFEKVYRDKSSYFSKKAKQELKSCAFAKKIIPDSVPVRIFNSGNLINSTNSELNAVLMDDTTMYFSSLRPEGNPEAKEIPEENYRMKIYSAGKKNERWESGTPLDTVVNHPSFHAGNGTFSKDRKRFYFSRCTNDFKCAIYVSEFKNRKWQGATRLENGINPENYTSTQPMVGQMEGSEVLFFVSDMPGGKGKLDIWTIDLAEINKGKTNVKPKNLSKINTIDNDLSPFYDSSEETLYFSSEWYYGLGGQDIFKTRIKGKNFSSPENLEYPYNTSTNDMYFSFFPDSKKGFLTSNRKGSYTRAGETCCNDIYEFDFPVKKDTIVAEEKKYSSLEMLNKYLPVTLYFHNDEPNPKNWDTSTTLNYLKTYNDYVALMEVYKEEYARGLSDENREKAKEDIEDFFSDYAEKGVSDLELFSELLLKELEKGQKIVLTVKGYASPLAKTDYNVNLTLRRISSLQNYLRETLERVFVPYLEKTAENGGWLEMVKIPFGEYKADAAVSDNYNDQRNSVYSRKAALERKIEIMSVSQAINDSLFPEITFEEEIHDFGTVREGEKLVHTFIFRNTGKENLLVKNVTSSCGCTVAKWTRNELYPEGRGEIEITFDTSGKPGKQVKTVTMETNGVPSVKVIHVTAEILAKE